jgi:hypothetical protein
MLHIPQVQISIIDPKRGYHYLRSLDGNSEAFDAVYNSRLTILMHEVVNTLFNKSRVNQ